MIPPNRIFPFGLSRMRGASGVAHEVELSENQNR